MRYKIVEILTYGLNEDINLSKLKVLPISLVLNESIKGQCKQPISLVLNESIKGQCKQLISLVLNESMQSMGQCKQTPFTYSVDQKLQAKDGDI